MHRFEVRGTTYLFDEESLICLAPDTLALRGIELWEESGREADSLFLKQKLADEFHESQADEFIDELGQLVRMLEEETPERPEVSETLRTIDLHVAHACNLACRYCFAGHGDYGVKPNLMSPEVAYRAVDMLVRYSSPTDRLGVVFFGGEPMMNFSLIRRTVEYIRDNYNAERFDYSITTNGTLIDDEAADFLVENRFTVLVSMDGVGETQDFLRPYKDGSPTSVDVADRIRRLSRRLPLGVRATVTQANLALNEECSAFCGLGFSRVHFAPVSTDDPELRLAESEVGRWSEEYLKLADSCLAAFQDRRPPAFGGYDRLLHQLAHRVGAVHGCGAGKRLVAVTPEGDLYPCHRYVGSPAWKMGTVQDGPDEQMQ